MNRPPAEADPYRQRDAREFAARERDDVRGQAPALANEPIICPACGAACETRDIRPGGAHYRYFSGQCSAQVTRLEAQVSE